MMLLTGKYSFIHLHVHLFTTLGDGMKRQTEDW